MTSHLFKKGDKAIFFDSVHMKRPIRTTVTEVWKGDPYLVRIKCRPRWWVNSRMVLRVDRGR